MNEFPNRKSPAQMARFIKNNPELVGELFDNTIHLQHEQAPAAEVVNDVRPEVYAILGVVIDKLVNNALDNRELRPPFGFVHMQIEAYDVFHELQELLACTLVAELSTLLYDEESLRPIFDRLDNLIDSAYGSITKRQLILSGINTATQDIVRALCAIARQAKLDNPNSDSPKIAELARDSVAVAEKIAGVSIAQIPSMEMLLDDSGQQNNAEHLSGVEALAFKTTKDGRRKVDFIAPIVNIKDPRTSRESGRTIGEIKAGGIITLRCPALIEFEGEDGISRHAIEKLWQWAIDVAEQRKAFDDPCIFIEA